MAAFDTSPVMLIVGVADIALLNVAVMVTTFEPVTILLESVLVRFTVGAGSLKITLSVPA